MQTTATLPRSHKHTLRDIIALTKPRITLLVLITAAGGAWLAGVQHSPLRTALLLSMISLLVGGANALNCYLERDSDRLMERTASRPLPAGRLAPQWGLIVGLVLGLGTLAVLALSINMLTAALGALALFSYVVVYTPMKQTSPTALLVGAVPGAMPPSMRRGSSSLVFSSFGRSRISSPSAFFAKRNTSARVSKFSRASRASVLRRRRLSSTRRCCSP